MENATTATVGLEFYEESWFYVVMALAITIVFQLLCFMVAATCKFDLLTDFAGSTNFMALALISLCVRGFYDVRQIVLTVIVTAVRLELAIFLLVRVCVRKKDDRFDETREKCCKFLAFWIGQMMWVWVCMLPVVYVNSSVDVVALGPADYIGWALMLFGFLFQMIADVHKYLFKKNPDNKGKICDTGLWSITRHPNYFGEVVLWWGVLVAGIPLFLVPGNEGWWATIVSPLFTMLILLGGSGIPTSEGKNLARFYKDPKKRDVYARYHKRTPPLIPFCPCWYEKLPMGCKAVCCCEFPCYQYKEDLEEDVKPETSLLKEGENSSHGTFVASEKSPSVEMNASDQKAADPEDPKSTQIVTPKKSIVQ